MISPASRQEHQNNPHCCTNMLSFARIVRDVVTVPSDPEHGNGSPGHTTGTGILSVGLTHTSGVPVSTSAINGTSQRTARARARRLILLCPVLRMWELCRTPVIVPNHTHYY